MSLPIMTISGIRGIVNETIDPLFISRIAYLQTHIVHGGTIVVGRDTRPSGDAFVKAAFRGIRAAGGTPVDLGIAPTPTTCLAATATGASGGIILTASHNPIQYNGYKMVHSSGRLYRGSEAEAVYTAFRRKEYPSDKKLSGFPETPEKSVDAGALHIDRILSQIDMQKIRSAKLCVAVDSINGAAGAVFPALLAALGVAWVGVHNKLDGDFVHNPEPRPEHLTDLSALLCSRADCWGGFVFDPDADRLATMGEKGEAISEELTLAFALQNLLARARSPVATNLSTSMVIDDVAGRFGAPVIRSKIGEANVVEAMERHGCSYGGEGNGGVIYPPVVAARDGLTAMALILELMAQTSQRITQLASSLPHYCIVKEKISCIAADPSLLINTLSSRFSSEKHDLTDGLKIIREYGWVHLRASNTEPIIRCYAEARTEQQARNLADMVIREVTTTQPQRKSLKS
ncbi:MAG: phosphoglucosamine mutase [Chitinispirillaceae bacterium]|nr:phosphoglucosamine mutase [Chitinispirillaceae bacterium]